MEVLKMAEKIEVIEEVTGENGYNPMLETAHKVLLAGIGVIALTQEEVEKFVNKLVERGGPADNQSQPAQAGQQRAEISPGTSQGHGSLYANNRSQKTANDQRAMRHR
jgi:hypothetical protein